MPREGQRDESPVNVSPELPSIFEAKAALWRELQAVLPTLDEQERQVILTRVFEHAVGDGLELASLFHIPSEETVRIFQTSNVGQKHPEIPLRMQAYENRHTTWFTGKDSIDIECMLIATAPSKRQAERQMSKSQLTSDAAQKLYEEVDRYYARLLSERELRPVDQGKPRTAVENAENYLKNLQTALSGHYYADPVKEFWLDTILERHGSKLRGVWTASYAQDPDCATFEQFTQILRNKKDDGSKRAAIVQSVFSAFFGKEFLELIERESLLEDNIAKTPIQILGIPLDNPEMTRRLAQAEYRPTAMVADMESRHAEQALIEDIKKLLSRMGYDPKRVSVAYNETTKKYEAVRDQTGGERVKKESKDGKYFDFDRFVIYKRQLKSGSGSSHISLYQSPIGEDWVFVRDQDDAYLLSPTNIKGPVFEDLDRIFFDPKLNFPIYTADGSVLVIANKVHRIPGMESRVYAHVSKVISNRKICLSINDFRSGADRQDVIVATYDENGGVISWQEQIPFDVGRNIEGLNGEVVRGSDVYIGVHFKNGDNYILKNGQEWLDVAVSNRHWELSEVGSDMIVEYWDGFRQYKFVVNEDRTFDSHKVKVPEKVKNLDRPFLIEKPIGNELVDVYLALPDGREIRVPDTESRLENSECDVRYGGQFESIYFFVDIETSTDSDVSLAQIIDQRGRVYAEFDNAYFDIKDDQFTLIAKKDKKIIFCSGNVRELMATAGLVEAADVLELSPDVTRRLDLLTTLKSPTVTSIQDYFLRHYLATADGGGKIRSRATAAALTQLVREHPEEFLDTMSAVSSPATEADIERIVFQLFPDVERRALADKERQARERQYRDMGIEIEPGAVFAPGDWTHLADADPRKTYDEALIEWREAPPQFVLTGVYGAYDKRTARWQRAAIPVEPDLEGSVKEVTGTITPHADLRSVELPLVLGGEIVPERIKGLKGKKEKVLESKKTSTGQVQVTVPKGVGQVTFTEQCPELPPALSAINRGEYDAFRLRLKRTVDVDLCEPVEILPPEWQVFLHSIKQKQPKEQVELIEGFVRSVSYYDMDNGEVVGQKDGLGLAQRWSFMKNRLQKLRAKDAQIDFDKQYAGVCADFATMSVALLRSAGFAAGVMEGFRPGSKKVTLANAHACAFVVWPSEGQRNGVRLVPVDGTPSAGMSTELQQMILFPDLATRERARQEKLESEPGELSERTKKVLDMLEAKDMDAIRALRNGELEEAVNALLHHTVKASHTTAIRNIFTVMRYSPVRIESQDDFNDPQKRADFLTFVAHQMKEVREEQAAATEEKNAGSKFIHMIQEAVRQFETDAHSSNHSYIFDLLESALDASKEYLSSSERLAATAVITFLRAQHMVKK